MKHLNLNNKRFVAKSNSANGEVDEETFFNYFQIDDLVWAEYEGPQILKGYLIGKFVDSDRIQFNYQHVNIKMELLTGKCTSVIEILVNGKLRLIETWQWSCGDYSSGESIIDEL